MYEILKSVISAGGYKLADIQRKVKKLYVLGDLTEEQMDELLALAAVGISTDAERPETLKMIQSIADRIAAVEARVKALEGGGDEGNADAGEDTESPAYRKWKAWDGISNDYQPGAIVSHNGALWQSVYNGQNVWEPGAPGTEALWVKYEEV